MSVVIPRHSKIPITITGNYQTASDYQKSILINVYEGENKYVKDNHFLGGFNLVDIPIKKAGEVKDDVTFKIDENGILTVTAVETSTGKNNYIKIINDKGFNKDEIVENINKTFVPLAEYNNKEFKNYKKEMTEYYKYYIETYDNKERKKYLYNFCQTLINFINTFEKEGNDTLGNKYFLYIKVLFQGFKELIQLKAKIEENDKNFIITNSKNFLKILSFFKNTNYKAYIKLLNIFNITLSQDEIKQYTAELEKEINEERNNILFDLTIYVMDLIKTKADQFLISNKKFSRYTAKYLYQNCIQISQLFIKSDRDLSKNAQLKKSHTICYEKCLSEIKKINSNSLIEIDKIKSSGKLINQNKNMEREDLLILLDNFREILHNIQGTDDYELEAIILSNIVKIKYKYLNSQNYTELRIMSEQCVALAKQTNRNVEQFKWYIEISGILQELRKRFEDKERYEQENFENKYKNERKQIFDEIKEYRKKKTNVEFIEFILQKYPPKKDPLKKNQTVEEQWNKNKKSFLEKLSARYNPDNYPKNTEEEKLNYTIYHSITNEINAIMTEINPNRIELKE